ncbi:MAG: type III pantothenate kinase [bacterium]|nr:type III pantothenate kinase [bacterium]MDD5353628.1 type III pantothenate kinase [bacterium]MDD5756508.1 type III pantothenate kinase [bacterium]
MLLAIDIGNTNVVVGVFQAKTLVASWRFTTDNRRTEDEYGLELTGSINATLSAGDREITGAIIASVVPSLTDVWVQVCRKYIKNKALVVEAKKVPMPILYDIPGEVGTDRIVNALAAWELYRKKGEPLIIVDFGTATTFDVVSKNGEYLGGAIAPGIGISCEALFSRTAKLPKVELVKPDKCLGKNTVHSMQAGLVFGFLGQVKEILKQLKKEIKGRPVIVGTGGLVNLIQNAEKIFDKVNQNLTLIGLRMIHETIISPKKKPILRAGRH